MGPVAVEHGAEPAEGQPVGVEAAGDCGDVDDRLAEIGAGHHERVP
jgi:hypothetical protein